MMIELKLALINNKNYHKSTRAFSIIYIIVSILFFIIVTLSKGFITLSNNYKTNDPNLLEVSVYPEYQENKIGKYDLNILKQISLLDGVLNASQSFNAFLSDNYNIKIDDNVIDVMPFMKLSNRLFSVASYKTVLKNNNFNYVSPIIYGRDFDNTSLKQAIIDENMCYILDYENPMDLVGKKITIELSDITIDEVEIVGVISYKYGIFNAEYLMNDLDEYTRKSKLDSPQCNPFIFSDGLLDEITRSMDLVSYDSEAFLLYVNNTDNVKLVCDEIENMFNYETDNELASIEKKALMVKSISIFAYALITLLLIIDLIIIINSLINRIDKQRDFTEMILKIGFKERQIERSYILGNIVLVGYSSIISIMIALIFSVALDSYLSKAYSTISSYSKYVFLLDIKKIIVYIIFVELIVILFSFIVTKKQVKKIHRRM